MEQQETNPIKLSILVCTIQGREEQLKKLEDILRPQLPADESVELIIKEELHHKQGGPTIGANRNALLELATGDYIAFVDDDDLVSYDYVQLILGSITLKQQGDVLHFPDMVSKPHGTPLTPPDVVGFKGNYYSGSNPPELFIHSIKYKDWFTKDGIHYRCCNHLNPVRKELALKAGFNEKNFGEDRDYSFKLRDILKDINGKEVFIDKVIYHYLK